MFLAILPTPCLIFSKSLSLAGKVHFTDRIRFYDMTKLLQTDDLNQIEKP